MIHSVTQFINSFVFSVVAFLPCLLLIPYPPSHTYIPISSGSMGGWGSGPPFGPRYRLFYIGHKAGTPLLRGDLISWTPSPKSCIRPAYTDPLPVYLLPLCIPPPCPVLPVFIPSLPLYIYPSFLPRPPLSPSPTSS